MAGNEISWIRARPKELRLVEASGRNNPMIRETGRRKKTNDSRLDTYTRFYIYIRTYLDKRDDSNTFPK